MDDWGDYDFGGDYADYSTPAYDPNQNTWDPASAYYQPQGWTSSNYISPADLPSGGGSYSVGGGDWNDIYAPAAPTAPVRYMDAGAYDASRGAAPSPRTSGYGQVPTPSSDFSLGGGGGFNFSSPSAPRSSAAPMSGARSVAQQAPQMISMGTPERTLYDRYKSLLMQPDQLQQDPAYKFMYNQGLQALNRSLAAKRMSLSSNAMNQAMEYGSGMTAKYMQDLLPQYRAGASEELQRFLGPAGLLPRYAGVNNATIGQSNQMVNNADDRALYRDMLAGGGGGMGQDWGSGIGYGGMSSGYTQQPRSYAPAMPQRTLASSSPSDYDLYDLMDEASYA